MSIQIVTISFFHVNRFQIYSKAPNPIQSMVVRDVSALRVCNIHADYDQHHHPSDEVPQPACGVQQGSGHAQYDIYSRFCVRVHIQTGCL